MPSLSESFIASSSMAEVFAALKKCKSQTGATADADVSKSEKLVMKVVSSDKIVMKIATLDKTMMKSQHPTKQLPTVAKNRTVKTLMEMANTSVKNVQVSHSSMKGRPLTRREVIHGWWWFLLLHFLYRMLLVPVRNQNSTSLHPLSGFQVVKYVYIYSRLVADPLWELGVTLGWLNVQKTLKLLDGCLYGLYIYIYTYNKINKYFHMYIYM